jgi:hypothetical protein
LDAQFPVWSTSSPTDRPVSAPALRVRDGRRGRTEHDDGGHLAKLGEIVLDCAIMPIERADPHIVLNRAAPNTGAAEKLAQLRERVATAAR